MTLDCYDFYLWTVGLLELPPGLKPQAEKLLKILAENPYTAPPPYEKLVGNLQGFYSRRISIQHRLIYRIVEAEKTVHVLRMWTHYQ